MALTPRLDLRQSQQLVMTPQLQQAIKLLQFTNLELGDFVLQEVEKNPLLEMSDTDGGPAEADRPDRPEAPDSGEALDSGEAPAGDPDGGEPSADRVLRDGQDHSDSADAPLDADFEQNVFNHDGAADRVSSSMTLNGAGAVRTGGVATGEMEPTSTADPTLQELLSEQMAVAVHGPTDRIIAAHLIDMVDDAGYILEGLDEVPDRLGCDPADVERVLATLQTFEPSGVFARGLAECLGLQLAERDRLDPAMQALLDNLELLARRDMPALRRICRVDGEDLADMIEEIRALNPKPGLACGGEPVQPVVPDVFVRRAPDGTWAIELNSDTLPKVLVNGHYYAELSERTGRKEDKAYLSECLSNANWLVKALDQRARTILRVSTELVRQQEAFFNLGVRHLKPLTLKDIADAIDMHESTISRVTSNKFMATERGIFELKYFFTSAISSSGGGEAHSAEAVRDRIRQLIDEESPKAVLSDDKIVEVLRADGVDIARRTVAKYREAMRIPSSVQRRRLKSLSA